MVDPHFLRDGVQFFLSQNRDLPGIADFGPAFVLQLYPGTGWPGQAAVILALETGIGGSDPFAGAAFQIRVPVGIDKETDHAPDNVCWH